MPSNNKNSKISIQTAFNLPNERAIDYFINKKVLPASQILDLGVSAHAKAFTLANINNLNLLQDFKNSLDLAIKNGDGFSAWRNSILDTAKAKGWTNNGDIFDADTGSVIAPHRLKTIFHTNMNGAFQAGRYQSQLDNTIFQPFWEYVAVGDAQTRPSHMELSGTIKHYDDAFWQTFYPPIDYRCRCTVIARSEDHMQTNDKHINTTDIAEDKDGNAYFKPVNDKVYPHKSFAYNGGRHGFRPDLDKYDPVLAHEFAKRDMKSPEFLMQYARLEREYLAERKSLNLAEKERMQSDDLIKMRNNRRYNINFSAGVINNSQKLSWQEKTVWLSDDTMLKQFNSRLGNQGFGAKTYALLPDIINNPDYILLMDGTKHIFLSKNEGYTIRLLLKRVDGGAIFMESAYGINDKELAKLLKSSKIQIIKQP